MEVGALTGVYARKQEKPNMASRRRGAAAAAAVSEDRKLRLEHFERTLKVPLSIEEIAKRADRAAHCLKERDSKEAEMKAAADHVKSQIKELEAELRRLSNDVRDQATYEVVECERLYDYEAKTVTETRLDSGEVIESRAMTAVELQMPLELGDGKKTPPDEGGSNDPNVN